MCRHVKAVTDEVRASRRVITVKSALRWSDFDFTTPMLRKCLTSFIGSLQCNFAMDFVGEGLAPPENKVN